MMQVMQAQDEVRVGDRRVEKIWFTLALIDAQGKIGEAKEGQIDLALTDATFKRLAASGVSAKIGFQVPEGIYNLRQVSEEAMELKIACSTYPVEVH